MFRVSCRKCCTHIILHLKRCDWFKRKTFRAEKLYRNTAKRLTIDYWKFDSLFNVSVWRLIIWNCRRLLRGVIRMPKTILDLFRAVYGRWNFLKVLFSPYKRSYVKATREILKITFELQSEYRFVETNGSTVAFGLETTIHYRPGRPVDRHRCRTTLFRGTFRWRKSELGSSVVESTRETQILFRTPVDAVVRVTWRRRKHVASALRSERSRKTNFTSRNFFGLHVITLKIRETLFARKI